MILSQFNCDNFNNIVIIIIILLTQYKMLSFKLLYIVH